MELERQNNNMQYAVTDVPILLIWICCYSFLRDNLANIIMSRSYKFFFQRYKYLLITEVIKNLATLCALITSLVPVSSQCKEIYSLTVGLLWWRLFISYIELNVNLATIMLSVGRVSTNLSMIISLLSHFRQRL